MHLALWLLAALLAGCAIPIPAIKPLTLIEPVDEVRTADLGEAERASVRLQMLSARLKVAPAQDVGLLRGHFHYNVEEWAPKVVEDRRDNVKILRVRQGLGSQIPLVNQERYTNTWAIGLAQGVPVDLNVEMGSGQADLDLTGLALTRLSATAASSDLSVAFNAPNSEPMSLLRLTTGAGKSVATGLGYANFDQLSVVGGAGTMDLDFHGDFKRSAVADVKAGAGRITIRVPDDIGVRVTFSGLPVGRVDTTGFVEEQEKVYVNSAYGEAMLTLTVRITTGLGTVALISE